MSNLVKYIQTINESEAEGSAIKYEKLIYHGFRFTRNRETIIKKIENGKKTEIDKTQTDEKIKKLKEIQNQLQNLEKNKIKEKDASELEKLVNLKKEIKNIDSSLVQNKNNKEYKDNQYIGIIVNIKKYIKNNIDLNVDNTNIAFYNNIKKIENDKDYEKAFLICEKFIKEQKIEKIIKVRHLGLAQPSINQYWIDLFDSTQNKSIGKTDIYLKAKTQEGIKEYNLSLKSTRGGYQIASPTYIDIYAIVIHAIDIVLEKIKNAVSNTLTSENSDKLKEIEKRIDDLQEKIKINSNDETNLKKLLGVDEIKTGKYATVITVSMLLDIFICNNNITEIKTLDDILKDENQLKSLIDKSINDFKNKYYNSKDQNSAIISIKEEIITINFKIDNEKEKIEKLIKEFKNSNLISKNLSRMSSEEIFNDLKQNNFFGNIDEKKAEYINYIKFKFMKKNANNNFEKIVDKNEIFNLIKIEEIKELNNSSVQLFEKIILEHNDDIKKEIIREAITGCYKFSGQRDIIVGSKNKNIANYIFEFNQSKIEIKIIPINTNEDLDKYVTKIINEVKFDFSFKGTSSGDNKSSIISLRIKKTLSNAFNKIKQIFDSSYQNDLYLNNSHLNIYEESVFTGLIGNVKKEIESVYYNFKIKILKILYFSKNKTTKLLNLFGLSLKIKKASMPKWIVDKL
jgi:hypothetical protein